MLQKRLKEDLENLKKCLVELNALGRQIEGNFKQQINIDNYMEKDRLLHLIIAQSAHNSVLLTVYSGVNLMLREKLWKVLKMKSILKRGIL